MKYLGLVVLLVLLSACGILNKPDVPATLRVENTAYIAEATVIAQSSTARAIEVAITEQWAGTTVAQTSNLNRVLLATAHAVIPPTPQRQVGGTPISTFVASADGGSTPAPGSSQFVNTGVTSRKRDSDGCAEGYETQFTPDISTIYAITQAVSISAGTVMAVSWSYDGQVISESSYTVSQDESNFCIWFYIDSSSVTFSPGSWAVRFSADGQPVDPQVAFTIVDPAAGS